ncbi:MAG: type III-A CRISPR-associated protein Csm2 [Clostridiales bacterium]|nr:type III-A CRISPR-associated protein Csm2 [Clostridiales bacterium]
MKKIMNQQRRAEEMKPEDIVKKLGRSITITQIRKLLTGINSIANKVKMFELANDGDVMSKEIVSEIEHLRIRFLYQAGRQNPVKKLERFASIDKKLKNINGSIKKFKEFNRFIEEIVAYHKYHWGES